MTRNMKSYQLHFDENEFPLFDKIEEARLLKGMTKKAFFLYGVANMVPELAGDIIEYLAKRPYSKNLTAITKEAQDGANNNN